MAYEYQEVKDCIYVIVELSDTINFHFYSPPPPHTHTNKPPSYRLVCWEDSHMKGVGMPVVSLRHVNLGFWSHLGCSWQNTIIVLIM